MSYIPIDTFIEAFAAELITRGQRTIRLNDNATRDALLSVYELLEELIASERERTPPDTDYLRSLVNIRSVFRPSSIGSFDQFEALLRTKQDYLTEHPNPYYHDIVLRLSVPTATRIVEHLEKPTARLVRKAAQRYVGAERVN